MKKLSDYEDQAVVLSYYDSGWPQLFDIEKAALLEIFGEESTLVEHIGSTAVPGMTAKPVIDIMLGVPGLHRVDDRLTEVEAQGWFYVPEYEDEMPFRRFFLKCRKDGSRSHHLHAVESGSDFWVRHIEFRDYLRANSAEAEAYGAFKLLLLAEKIDRHKIYSAAKGEFIGAMAERARLWSMAQKG